MYNEKIKSLVQMYKKDKVTDYVLERELSVFFTEGGVRTTVRLEKEIGLNKTSYCFFLVPERREEGFHMNIVVDVNCIKIYYSEDEIVEICNRLRNKLQTYLGKYHRFVSDNAGKEVGRNAAIGFLLSLYSTYRSSLIVESDSFLPDENDVLKYADIFTMETANSEDLETIKVRGMISNVIIDLCKKYIKASDSIKLKFMDTYTIEKPTFCLGDQEIRKHCTSTFGVRDHKEIPYDYLPKTNQ